MTLSSAELVQPNTLDLNHIANEKEVSGDTASSAALSTMGERAKKADQRVKRMFDLAGSGAYLLSASIITGIASNADNPPSTLWIGAGLTVGYVTVALGSKLAGSIVGLDARNTILDQAELDFPAQ